MGVAGGPLIDDGGQVSVRPGKHSPFLEKLRGGFFVKCADRFVSSASSCGIVEESELRSARPVVFNRLDDRSRCPGRDSRSLSAISSTRSTKYGAWSGRVWKKRLWQAPLTRFFQWGRSAGQGLRSTVQQLILRPGNPGRVLSQLQAGKFVSDDFRQKIFFVGDLFFRTSQKPADHQDQGPGGQGGLQFVKVARPFLGQDRGQIHIIQKQDFLADPARQDAVQKIDGRNRDRQSARRGPCPSSGWIPSSGSSR